MHDTDLPDIYFGTAKKREVPPRSEPEATDLVIDTDELSEILGFDPTEQSEEEDED